MPWVHERHVSEVTETNFYVWMPLAALVWKLAAEGFPCRQNSRKLSINTGSVTFIGQMGLFLLGSIRKVHRNWDVSSTNDNLSAEVFYSRHFASVWSLTSRKFRLCTSPYTPEKLLWNSITCHGTFLAHSPFVLFQISIGFVAKWLPFPKTMWGEIELLKISLKFWRSEFTSQKNSQKNVFASGLNLILCQHFQLIYMPCSFVGAGQILPCNQNITCSCTSNKCALIWSTKKKNWLRQTNLSKIPRTILFWCTKGDSLERRFGGSTPNKSWHQSQQKFFFLEIPSDCGPETKDSAAKITTVIWPFKVAHAIFWWRMGLLTWSGDRHTLAHMPDSHFETDSLWAPLQCFTNLFSMNFQVLEFQGDRWTKQNAPRTQFSWFLVSLTTSPNLTVDTFSCRLSESPCLIWLKLHAVSSHTTEETETHFQGSFFPKHSVFFPHSRQLVCAMLR